MFYYMLIYLETYGCTMNQADSQIMEALLADSLTNRFDEADCVIINSCGVKGPTERKIRKRIAEIMASDKALIVTGCLPLISPVQGAVIGTNVYDILDAVEQVKKGKSVNIIATGKKNKLSYPRQGDGVVGIIPISEGCLGSCTYCAARLARGHLFSYPVQSVVNTARSFLSSGYRELQLTSQDTGCYGMDHGTRLPALLEMLTSLEGKFKIRVGMMNPNHVSDILDDLLDVYTNEKIFTFLHIPVQSGNDDILQKMNRKYTVQEFTEICERARKAFPHLCLWTDIIVGFPTETDEQFQDTLELVKNIRPDKINVTRFSPRPNTPASKMDQIPGWIKKERSRALHTLRMDISHEINKSYVGNCYEILIDKQGIVPSTMIGRTGNYKPVVCTGNRGEFTHLTITSAQPTYLKAL
jgi:MiaB-like tRNA modifying enzyme